MSDEEAGKPRDNLYTPSAGSMIIHLQREGGLASRTLVLSKRQVRMMRFVFSRYGLLLSAVFLGSWLFFAIQTARVPLLTQRLAAMSADSARLDTLQLRLDDLQRRYAQVEGLMSAGVSGKTTPTPPTRWPLAVTGYITRATQQNAGAEHDGLDIAVPVGTDVHAAGGGKVLEVGESNEYGHFIRLAHSDQYESFYGHLGKVLVAKGVHVGEGQVIGTSGNTGRSTAPHLHFEIRQAGTAIDPQTVIRKRGGNGNLR